MLPMPKIFERDFSMSVKSILIVAALGFGGLSSAPSFALNPGSAAILGQQVNSSGDFHEVRAMARGGAVRRTTVVGPRGGVSEPYGCARRRRCTTGLCRRRCALGTAGSVLLAQGRSHRGRCCHRLCNRRHGRRLGRRGSRSRHVLVLHGSIAHAGLLGLLPVTASVWSRCHDVAADRDRAERTTVGR